MSTNGMSGIHSFELLCIPFLLKMLLCKFFLLGWQSWAAEKKTRQTAVVSSVHRQAVFLIRLTIERAFAYLFYKYCSTMSANFSGN